MELLREFKPALMFLAKFLGLYLAGNILYGSYIESFGSLADDLTHSVTVQTSWLLDRTGFATTVEIVEGAPKVALKYQNETVLNVFEGCNGINVLIVYLSFLFAFGGPVKRLGVFLAIGGLFIHLFNLLRISLLFRLALEHSGHFYYFHKYFFTAALYVVVFALWAWWIASFSKKRLAIPR